MNIKLKDTWVAALRSGNYKQGRTKLRDSANNYCCLGVLCEMAGLVGELSESDGLYLYEGKRCFLPEALASELPSKINSSLIGMNDGQGRWDNNPQSFAEIADWIEANVPVTVEVV